MVKLHKFDYMSPTVGFTINKNESYKSDLGLILTMLYLLCVILAFVAFGRDIIEKQKPMVVLNKDTTTESGFMFNSTNFIFTMYSEGTWIPIPDYEKKLFAYFEVFDNFPGGYNTTTFHFSKCSEEVQDDFNRTMTTPRGNYWCFSPGTIAAVKKSREDSYYQSARFVVEYCDNDKFKKTDCLPLDDIKKSLKTSLTLSFSFYDYYVNSFDYSNPIKKTFYQLSSRSSVDNFGRIVVNFETIDYRTDVGWLIEDTRREVASLVSSVTYTNLSTPGGRVLFSHQFLNSQWANTFRRRYIKVQEIFANIGGIVNLIAIFFKIICDYLVKPEILSIFFDQINKSHLHTSEKNKSFKEINDAKITNSNFVTNLIKNFNKSNLEMNQLKNNQEEGPDNSIIPDNSINILDLNNKFKKNSEEIKNMTSLNHLKYRVDELNAQKFQASKDAININKIINDEIKFEIKNDFNNKSSNEKTNNYNVNELSSFHKFNSNHKRLSQKLHIDNHVKKLFNFDYEDFSIAEKILRVCLFGNKSKIKLEKLRKVLDIYNETFSIEYSANNYRKLEIMRFLLFNEVQNKIIDNLDLPELKYYQDFDFFESKKEILEDTTTNMINFKLKMLV